MTYILKNAYSYNLDDTVIKYNNMYLGKIKMKLVKVKQSHAHISVLNKEVNMENLKFKFW